jgi:hypothetical protein
MKTAGMALGIVGGALAIIFALISIFGIVVADTALRSDAVQSAIQEAQQQINENGGDIFMDEDIPLEAQEYLARGNLNDLVRTGFGLGAGFAIAFSILGLIGGVLGLIGGIVLKTKSTLSGVFLIIGAVLTAFYCLPLILMVIAAVFAFVKPKPPITPEPVNP